MTSVDWFMTARIVNRRQCPRGRRGSLAADSWEEESEVDKDGVVDRGEQDYTKGISKQEKLVTVAVLGLYHTV